MKQHIDRGKTSCSSGKTLAHVQQDDEFVVAWADDQLIAASWQLHIDGLKAGTADQAAPWFFRHRSSSAEVGACEWV